MRRNVCAQRTRTESARAKWGGQRTRTSQRTTDQFVDSEWPHPTLDPQPQMRRIWRRRINLPYPAQKQSPLSSRPLFHSICPISLSLSTAPLMYVLHSTSTPAERASEIACSFVRSLSPSSLAHSLLAVARSVLPQLALGITFPLPLLPPPTTPANAAPTAPAALRLRPTLPYTWFRAAAAAGARAYLGKIKDGGHDSKHGGGGGQAREGGRAGNGGGPLRLVARSHSETEGRTLEGRKWQRRRRGAT